MVIRKLVLGTLVAGLAILGTLAQAGAHLLALPSPASNRGQPEAQVAAFAAPGRHAVGILRTAPGEAPIPMTVWYPALDDAERSSSLTYSYAMHMLDAESSIALATFQGVAQLGAAPDPASGPYPLVVLSHGFAITGESYAWLAEHLASHGFVVVAPEHDESLDPGTLWRSTIERPRDIASVLDFLDEAVRADDLFAGLVDTENAAVVGHSYGGYTALAAAGARIDGAEFEATCAAAEATADPLTFLCDALLPRLDAMAELSGLGAARPGLWPAWAADGRVDAVVSMAGDAAMFGEKGLARITIPVLAVGGTADTDSPFRWGTELTYDHVASERKVQVALDGAQHMIFAGECARARRIVRLLPSPFCADPVWDRERAHDLVRHVVTAFLLTELRGDRDAATAFRSGAVPFPEVIHESEGYEPPG